jgi:hypothetical protein
MCLDLSCAVTQAVIAPMPLHIFSLKIHLSTLMPFTSFQGGVEVGAIIVTGSGLHHNRDHRVLGSGAKSIKRNLARFAI